MLKIALFGTSADPPTTGHQEILIWLSQNFDLVAVWASDNPFKSHQTSLEHRTKMLGLLIEDIPDKHNICIYPELSNSRSIFTLERAQTIWPNAEFSLAIGADLVSSTNNKSEQPTIPILSWYRINDLLKQIQLLVVPRPGYPLSKADLEQLESIGAKVAIADLNTPPVSSTEYRERGDKTNITPPPIQAYINREHLYA